MPFGSFWIKKKEEKKKVRKKSRKKKKSEKRRNPLPEAVPPIMTSPSDQAQWDTGSVC